MSKHIGIVACSAEGAALCYRTICLEGGEYLGEDIHPEISMHNYPLKMYTPYFETDSWEKVADLMIASAVKLKDAGADFAICPDNTIHQAYDIVIEQSPIPWLHIAEVVIAEARENGMHHLGVLGTRYLMEGPVYRNACSDHGLEYSIPDRTDRERINSHIFNELVQGQFTEGTRNYFVNVIDKLHLQGCDAVVLGCTEIPLLVTPDVSPLPVLDSTRILGRAALHEAMKE